MPRIKGRTKTNTLAEPIIGYLVNTLEPLSEVEARDLVQAVRSMGYPKLAQGLDDMMDYQAAKTLGEGK